MWWLCLIQQKEVDRLKLEWNVFSHDFNKKEIETYNIFEHGRFLEDVKKNLKKCETKEEFAEKFRRDLFYYFGSKCEWEVVITSWPHHITTQELDRLNSEREKTIREYNREPYRLYVSPEVGEKVDVYSQVSMNFSHVVDYVWSHKRSKK